MTDTTPNRALPVALLLALIILLAAALRLPSLQTAPVGGHGDVAWVGLNALDWVDRGVWPFYVRELYSPEFPMVYLDGLLMPFTGISYLPPRLITAFSGILFVVLLYPATYWLLASYPRSFRQKAGLLAALSGAVSLHAMYLSRLGMESPPFLAGLTLLVWLTAWAWQRSTEAGAAWRWTLAGAALGFNQYLYLPARLLPLLMAVWMGYLFLTDRTRLRQQFKGWLIMAGASLVVVLPAIVLFLTVPGSFAGRADTGTAITGGWIWAYDTSAEGGLLVLLLKKISLTLLAFGIYWNGPYTIMNQPMLGPLFFLGFIAALVLLLRHPKLIGLAWPALAIPIMLLTDLISGAVVEIHALHQMGILPFVFILSGVGVALLLDQIAAGNAVRPVLIGVFLLAGVLPGILGTYRYLNEVIPAAYAAPDTGWRTEQIDVDVSARLNAEPDRAYLLPYSEYSRSNFAWLLADQFRERRSAIAVDGTLQIPDAPAELTVVRMSDPERIRHDGRPSKDDPRLYVLLHKGKVLLLPPFTAEQESALSEALKQSAVVPIVDRSNTTIADLHRLKTPSGLFAPRSVIDVPLEATFNNEIQLKGYSISQSDLVPGKVVWVTLFWQAKVPPSEDYHQVAQIWNDGKDSLASTTDFPYGGAYRTRIWRTDEIVPTHHWLQLPENLPVGRYTLAIKMTHLLGGQSIPTSGANVDPALQVALAPDLRVAAPTVSDPGTPTVQTAQFGKVLAVSGIDMRINDVPTPLGVTLQAAPGQTLRFDFTWRTLARPPKDYHLFLHLAPALDKAPVTQSDVQLGGSYPTGAWRPGELRRDRATLALPVDLPPGEYVLLMGLYDWQTGERLPLSLNGAAQADARWAMVKITINAAK